MAFDLSKLRSATTNYKAAIAALHDEATTADDTDWPQILALYDILTRLSTNPIIALNRAVAVAMVHGPAAGLRQLDHLEDLKTNHRLYAARAHLLEMSGDTSAAITNYQTAASLTTSQPEQRYLHTRAARLETDPPKGR